MYCSNCYRMLPDNSHFCPNCGTKIVQRTCINCGIILHPGEKKCRQCGIPVDGYKEPPKRTVDWVWGSDPSTHEHTQNNPAPSTGSWKDFRNDMSDLTQQVKNNWKGYAETAKQSYQQYQQNNTYTEDAPSAEYQSVPNSCPSCSSTNISYQTVSELKGIGCFVWLIILLFAFFANIFTGIFVLPFFLLIRKTKTVTYAVCQDCGHRCKSGRIF